MAVIGKIQKNSVLLLIVIGAAMLAFIFTDFMKSGGDEVERLDMGTIYGEPIDEEEYEELTDLYLQREKQTFFQQQSMSPNPQQWTPEMEESAKSNSQNQAFNEVVRRDLMNREFDKVGITCTVDELNDMIHGNHVHAWVMDIPIFRDRLGAFSKDSVRNFINRLEVEPDNEADRENWLLAREQWSDFEQELKDVRKADKYVTMIKRGLFVNSLEAKDRYYAANEKKQIKFVVGRYTDIAPDEMEVTDDEIKAFYDEHKDEKKYEQEESRDVDFITFPIYATEFDQEELKNEMDRLKTQFEATDNNLAFMAQHSEGNFNSDSAFFRYGSGDQFVFDNFMGNHQYPAVADEMMQEAEVGQVVGPFAYGSEVAIAKVTKVETELQAWVRHILVNIDATRTEEEAKAKADSIMAVINEKDNFVEMVEKYTDDPGSIENGGEYKWFNEGRMVPEFNDASFEGAIGQLQLVKTTYGYHIVEVLGRTERKIPALAVVSKTVKPSENTLKEMEQLVFDFIFEVSEMEGDSAFHRAAEDSSKVWQSSRIWMEQKYVMGLQEPDRLMKFAFNKNASEGDISDPILDGDKYVVAFLSNIIEEGAPEFEDVKEQMRNPALEDKKANYLIEQMSGKKGLTDVAAAVKNGTILQAEVAFGFNSIQGGGGNEPEVIGKLFTDIPVGSMTTPIKGNAGVYVVIVEGETEAVPTTDYSIDRENLKIARVGSADSGVIKALREKAEVKDNRRRIEIQG
jgi:parvulin-like peptidyl-prolyl isomerase